MSKVSHDNVKALVKLGHSKSKSEKALKDYGNNLAQAKNYLQRCKDEEEQKVRDAAIKEKARLLEIEEAKKKKIQQEEAEKLRKRQMEEDEALRRERQRFGGDGTDGGGGGDGYHDDGCCYYGDENQRQDDFDNNNCYESTNGDFESNHLHPCIAQYGKCRYGVNCLWKDFPADTCINYLQGSCIFGDVCRNRHAIDGVDLRMRPDPNVTVIQDPSDPDHSVIVMRGQGKVVSGERVQVSVNPETLATMPVPEAHQFNPEQTSKPSYSQPIGQQQQQQKGNSNNNSSSILDEWMADGQQQEAGDDNDDDDDNDGSTAAAAAAAAADTAAPTPFLDKMRLMQQQQQSFSNGPSTVVVSGAGGQAQQEATAGARTTTMLRLPRHPCMVQCGTCRFGPGCVHAQLPGDICVHWLNSRCRFSGDSCRYKHYLYDGGEQQARSGSAGAGGGSSQTTTTTSAAPPSSSSQNDEDGETNSSSPQEQQQLPQPSSSENDNNDSGELMSQQQQQQQGPISKNSPTFAVSSPNNVTSNVPPQHHFHHHHHHHHHQFHSVNGGHPAAPTTTHRAATGRQPRIHNFSGNGRHFQHGGANNNSNAGGGMWSNNSTGGNKGGWFDGNNFSQHQHQQQHHQHHHHNFNKRYHQQNQPNSYSNAAPFCFGHDQQHQQQQFAFPASSAPSAAPTMGSTAASMQFDAEFKESQAFDSLRTVFPDVDASAILLALRRCNGDVKRAGSCVLDMVEGATHFVEEMNAEFDLRLQQQQEQEESRNGGDPASVFNSGSGRKSQLTEEEKTVTLVTLCSFCRGLEPSTLREILERNVWNFEEAFAEGNELQQEQNSSTSAKSGSGGGFSKNSGVNRTGKPNNNSVWFITSAQKKGSRKLGGAITPQDKLHLQKLQAMFRELDGEVVEAVLRANDFDSDRARAMLVEMTQEPAVVTAAPSNSTGKKLVSSSSAFVVGSSSSSTPSLADRELASNTTLMSPDAASGLLLKPAAIIRQPPSAGPKKGSSGSGSGNKKTAEEDDDDTARFLVAGCLDDDDDDVPPSGSSSPIKKGGGSGSSAPSSPATALSSNPLYKETRDEINRDFDWRRARQEAYLTNIARRRTTECAIAAFSRRDHSTGRELLRQSRELGAKYARLNMLCMHALEREQDRSSNGLTTLDLHGFHVAEAVDVLARRLQLCKEKGITRLRVVAGGGAHSRDGRPVVLPAALDYVEGVNANEGGWCPISQVSTGSFDVTFRRGW